MDDLPDGEGRNFWDILRGILMSCCLLGLVVAGLTVLNVLFDLNLSFGTGSPTPLPDDWAGVVAMVGIAFLFGGLGWIVGLIGRMFRRRKRRVQ